MKKVTQILMIAFIGVVTVSTAKAQIYDPLAVQRINDLIVNNGLQATPNAPETWEFAEWNDENPKKVINLNLGAKYMKGDASFVGLTTLQRLSCSFNYLTKLDITNCPQLKILSCMDNYLTEIILTNYEQLEIIIFSKNKLSEFDLTNCDKLYRLECYGNNLTELDVTGLNNLTDFQGWGQYPPALTLYKNESEGYTSEISLNYPSFGNNAITYSDGVLKSTDSTVFNSEFTVQTIGNSNFKLSGTMNFNYSDDVGIDIIDDAQLTVYPNPNTGELVVTSYGLQVTNVEIYDISGKKQKAESRKEKAEIIIDISSLPVGIYLVKVITEQGEIVKKIVKQ